MTTYNTGNPIGSTDPRDLYDNAENLDEAVNSDGDTFQDRLGKSRLTWAGIVKAGSGDPAIAVDAAARAVDAAGRAENTEAVVDAAQQAVQDVAGAVDGQVAVAQSAANRAETARDAAFVNADVYPDVAAGLAAVADGEQFQVVVGDEIIRYRRDSASTRTEVARIIANAARRFSPIKTLQTSGTSQAQIGTIPEYTAYSSGDIFWWVPTSNNTGPMTININGLGETNVVLNRANVLRAGEIRTGYHYLIRISIAGGDRIAQVLVGGVTTGGLPDPLLTVQSSGTTESQVATTPFYDSYKAGDTFLWLPSKTSSAEGMTLNINSLGPLEVRKNSLIPLSAGDIIKGRFAIIRVSGTPGDFAFYIVGSVPSDIEERETAVESAPSLAVSNPNLFTALQSAALSTEGMTSGGISQIVVEGIPHWSTTGPIQRWGPFARESISGDTLSAAVNITSFDAENDSIHPRVAVIQYSNSSMVSVNEVARENVELTDFTPGFVRLEGVEIHPDCTHIGFFVGANSGGGDSTITYRDMLLCSGSNSVFRTAPVVSFSGGSKEVWVSPSGSDGGSGSSSLPFATLTRAAAALGGTGTIYLAAGDYGSQQLNAFDVKDLKIVGGADSSFERSLFRYGSKLTLSAVSGRTGVFSAPLTRAVSWLWVDGIPDEQTLVPYNEQHSLLNGRAHRLECTKVWHISAANLTDALDLIEMSATPACWRDASTNTVYLSLPDGADASSDVYGAYDDVGFFSNKQDIWTPEGHIELVGLDIRYGNIDTKSFRTSSLTDIRVVGAGNDGFDVGNWAELSLCSAGGSGSGSGLGDGFNAHNHAIWTYRDCYGHDNWDDGESSHQNCRVTGWGNIMEYNGGSGFTPALGAQQILHNCLSRKNATSSFRTGGKRGGFQVAGDPTETDPGIITSLEAYNCVSIGDRNGFYDGTGSSGAPAQRRLLAVNCKVFDAEETAYACAEIRDCTQSGSATAKSAGTVVVNSSIVS